MAKKIILGILALGFLASFGVASEKFRLRLNFRLNNDAVSLYGFNPQDYSVFEKNVPQDYFGSWAFLWYDSYENYGGVFAKGFPYRQGDSVPLMQSRQLTLNETDNRFGIGAEFRMGKNFWLTFQYNKPKRIVVNSLETLDFMTFWLLFEDPNNYNGYKYYEMWLHRQAITQLTIQELNSGNCQIGFSHSIIQDRGRLLNWLAGFDFWNVSQITNIAKKTYSLRPWLGLVNGPITEETIRNTEKKKLTRGFYGLELQVPIYRNLKIAASAKNYFGKSEVEFKNKFLLESPADSWKVKLPKNLINLSLIFSFGK